MMHLDLTTSLPAVQVKTLESQKPAPVAKYSLNVNMKQPLLSLTGLPQKLQQQF